MGHRRVEPAEGDGMGTGPGRAVRPLFQLGPGGVMVHTRPQPLVTEGHADTIHRLALHPDRPGVAVSAGADKKVLAWNIDNGRCVAALPRLSREASEAGVTTESVNQAQDLVFCVGTAGEYLIGGCDIRPGSDEGHLRADLEQMPTPYC